MTYPLERLESLDLISERDALGEGLLEHRLRAKGMFLRARVKHA